MRSEPVRRPNRLSEPVRRPNGLKVADLRADWLRAERTHSLPPIRFLCILIFFLVIFVFFGCVRFFFFVLGLRPRPRRRYGCQRLARSHILVARQRVRDIKTMSRRVVIRRGSNNRSKRRPKKAPRGDRLGSVGGVSFSTSLFFDPFPPRRPTVLIGFGLLLSPPPSSTSSFPPLILSPPPARAKDGGDQE